MGQTFRLATFLAPNMFEVYQSIASYLGKRLGIPVELVNGSSFDDFALGQADAGFICGLPYVNLRGQDPPPVELLAAPVLNGERFQGRPVYFSDVIVRRGRGFRSFADLRGCSWSYNDPDSQSGYGITRYWLAKIGARPGFFGKVIEAGFHQESIRRVAAGEVDASAIDCQVLAIELRDHPDQAGLIEVIDSLGPSTIQPVVAAARLPSGLKADLRAALLDMGDDPLAREALSKGYIERFAGVEDRDYDDIREMARISAAAGWQKLV